GLSPSASEDRLESAQSAEVAHEDLERFGQIHMMEAEPSGTGAAHAGPSVAIVRGALLRVPQDLVGLRDLLELGFGFGRLVAIGMVVHRELPIGFLDVGLGRGPRYPEQFVKFVHSSRSSTRRLVCSTRPMIFSYGIRVGPITPITPLSSPA